MSGATGCLQPVFGRTAVGHGLASPDADRDGTRQRFWDTVLNGAAHGALRSFLADIQAGTPPGPLSQRLMALDARIERRMIAHFKRWRRV